MTPEPPPPAAVGGVEAEVMEVVWELGEASVRAVMETLNATAEVPRAYTTYMTSLARLHRKGLLERRRDGKTDVYRPVYTRAAYADLRAQAEVAALVDTFGEAALNHFARQIAQLDPDRRKALGRLARGG
jgi:predicted transcriptional regulator